MQSHTLRRMIWIIPGLISCWGDREMGTAISCIKCSQVAGLIYAGLVLEGRLVSLVHASPQRTTYTIHVVCLLCTHELCFKQCVLRGNHTICGRREAAGSHVRVLKPAYTSTIRPVVNTETDWPSPFILSTRESVYIYTTHAFFWNMYSVKY